MTRSKRRASCPRAVTKGFRPQSGTTIDRAGASSRWPEPVAGGKYYSPNAGQSKPAPVASGKFYAPNAGQSKPAPVAAHRQAQPVVS